MSSTSWAITNFIDCLKVNIDGHTRPQIVTKLLLQVSDRELHNSLGSHPGDGGLKEARDADNDIIINDCTLRSLFPSELKKCQQDTRSCVVVNVVYLLKVYITNYYHDVIGIKKTQRANTKCSKHKVW